YYLDYSPWTINENICKSRSEFIKTRLSSLKNYSDDIKSYEYEYTLTQCNTYCKSLYELDSYAKDVIALGDTQLISLLANVKSSFKELLNAQEKCLALIKQNIVLTEIETTLNYYDIVNNQLAAALHNFAVAAGAKDRTLYYVFFKLDSSILVLKNFVKTNKDLQVRLFKFVYCAIDNGLEGLLNNNLI
ncbi:hypothetical protein COBT_003202, partial [Conglomerata obtusa]